MTASSLSRVALICVAFLAIAGFFLVTEHRGHAFGILPILLLLACPLLHLISHWGHGRHGGAGGEHHHDKALEKKARTP